MARLFNGTTDHAEITRDLSGSSVISVSLWFFLPNAYRDNNHAYFEYGNPNWTIGGFIFTPWSGSFANGGTTSVLIGFGNAGGTATWQDGFEDGAGIGPTGNVWHHAFFVIDRATPKIKLWIDGTPWASNGNSHTAAAYGNFANSVLNCFSRNAGASLIGAGRIAELAIWDGDVSGPAVGSGSNSAANSIHAAIQAPLVVSKAPLLYVPWLGVDSPEPDYSGGKHSATLTGTTKAHHQQTLTLLMPSSLASTDEPATTGATIDDVIPASINATSAMTGRVNAIHRLAPAAINATSAITGAVVGIIPLVAAAINATSAVVAHVSGPRRLIAAAINATSRINVFGFFNARVGSGPGNGGEIFAIRLAPNGTSETATLTAAVTATAALLELTGDGALPTDHPFCLTVDDEVVYVAQIAAGSYRIRRRGVSNTTPAAHLAGATVTWSDSYDMAIAAGFDIAHAFTADILSSGSIIYNGWLVCPDSSQAYLAGARYPMHVTSVLGVFDAGAGSTGTNRCDGAQPNVVCTPIGVSDDCPAALSNALRLTSDVLIGDVAVVRYTNPEASVLDLGPRAVTLDSWFNLKRVDASGTDVSDTDPNGIVVDTTGGEGTFTGAVNGEWLDPLGDGIDPSTGLPVANVHYTSVPLPGADRHFTISAEKGWPIGVLAVRQGNRRVPFWRSWDWHNFNFVYTGFGIDALFAQLVINRNGVNGVEPEVALPGPQDITGPDAVWDDGSYYFGVSWGVFIFSGPYLVAGPSIGGSPTLTPGGPTPPVPVPIVDFTGGVLGPSVTIPPSVEGGSGGGIAPAGGLHLWQRV